MQGQARALIDAAASERVRGSTAVALQAAQGLAELARERPEPAEFAPAFLESARVLLVNQTAMASLWRLVNDCLLAADAAEGPEFAADAVVDAAGAFALRVRRAHDAVVHELAPLLNGGGAVVTLSVSGTLERAFEALARAGHVERVLCCRSLPGGEGADLVKRLRAKRIRAELVEDAALGPALDTADVAVIGADAVTPVWVANKVGSRPLALTARAMGRRMLVVSDSTKMVPSPVAAAIAGRLERDPARALFETVPLREIDGWVSEHGLAQPATVELLARRVALHERITVLADELAAHTLV